MSRRNEEWRKNRHGEEWRRNRQEQSGWGNERFRRPAPRGLTGKEIGLYYRNRNKYGKKKSELSITLKVPNIVTTKLKNNLNIIGTMIEKDLEKRVMKSKLFKSEFESVPSTSKYELDDKYDDGTREPNVKQLKVEPDYMSQPGTSAMPDFIQVNSQCSSDGSDVRILTLRGAGDYKYGYQDIITGTFTEKLEECLAKGINIAKNNSEITSLSESLYDNQYKIFQSPQYKEMLKFRKTLPAYKKWTELSDMIKNNQIVVISGETGCGKSTQVPQIILEDAIMQKKGGNVKILVTQPRRIAASSLAARVAKERGEPMGNSVGYAVRLEKVEPRSRGSIMFCTTGILLVDLEVNQGLTEYSHVILDEVHERDSHIDLAMCMLKQVLRKRKDLKLILMSATLDADTLCSYFNNCPLMHIEGLAYPVQDIYLEEILRLTKYELPEKPPPPASQKPYIKHLRRTKEALRANTEKEMQYQELIGPWLESIKGDIHPKVYKTLKDQRIEDLNVDLIYELVKYICKGPEGAILIFLPGISEITKLLKLITNGGLGVQYEMYPLHSKLPSLEQNKIFERPPKQIRKIIVATNIAETSITIDDIVYVIDSGKIKYSGLNVEQHVNTLKTEWVSKANLHQRRGRAGRCQPGICYHLVSSRRAELLEERLLPELQRTDLLEPLLTIKRLRLGKAAEALRNVPDSPATTTIEKAVLHLQQCGALDEKETLTPLGWHMARLPVHPAAGKLLILGALFGCLDRAASVAAVWSFKDPFMLILEKEDEVKAAKRSLAQGEPSDHVAISEALLEYERCHWDDKRTFAYQYFLSISTMELLCSMKKQLGGNLRQMGFLASGDLRSSWENRNTNNLSLFKAIIAAALYPNVAAAKWKNLHSRNINKQVRVGAVDPAGPVSIHPSSVMCPPKRKPNKKFAPQVQLCSTPGANWLVYWLKQRSSELFLIDITLVYTLPLLFFGQLKQTDSTDENHCTVTITSFKVQMRKETAELLFKLRALLDDVLAAKIGTESTHAVQHSEFEEQVLNAVIAVITAEDERAEYLEESESDSSERDYGY